MNKFLIITDATCDLTKDYMDNAEVKCIPMLYSVDGQDYYMLGDSDGLDMKEFYERMRKGSVTKTAQINTEYALDIFRPLVMDGYDILYIGFSSALSGTVDSVTKALAILKEEFPTRNLLSVDSLCASMGEGLFVHYAVKQKSEGKTLEEIYNYLQKNKQKFCHYFTVDDLHFLHRGGRVSKLTAIVGSILGIKPVLHVSPEGKLINISKAMGRKKALKMLVEKMKNKIEDKNQPVFISHGDCYDDAKLVADMVTEEFGITDITINYIGPVIGSHSGPNTIALFFVGNDRKE